MLPLKDCRGYRSRYINALNRAVRALTPIAGRGIRLRQSAQGVVIEATAKGGGGGGSAPFSFRWRVTLETVTDDSGATTYTLHITPGSLWRDDGAGAVDLHVAPDGSTVTVSGAEWLAAGVTASGALYVVDNSAGATSGGVAYPLVYGDPTSETRRILLRVADLTVASSGVTLTQRQIGDALTGGASGLQLGPLTYEASGSTRRFVRYMGAWAFDADNDRWTFAKAVKADGSQYPAAETLSAREMLFRVGGTIYVAYRPDIGPAPTKWMSRITIRVSQGIDINPPQSETDTGSVTETTRDLTYFTDNTVANASTDSPLSVQVEEANEATAYEQT